MPSQVRKNPVLVATSILVVAAAFTAPRAHAACGEQRDFLVRADPLLATVRPADCATLLSGPPEFTWPMQHAHQVYTVALRFPDGHTETRTTDRNWLAWDAAVPPGTYTWRVSVAGRTPAKSDSRVFQVERVEHEKNAPAAARSSSPAAPPARETASIAAPAANLFRLEPAESWIPSARAPRTARKAAVGGFFGGFTE
ncbi:MAG TPA: hypothetical protein VN782_12160 [Usitatibacter sp.]|nr:hypothetical protein [Usitatibacter sp.]